MGIYDRDYVRNEKRSFLDTITTSGQVVKWLIVTNAIIFLVQLFTREGRGLGPFTNALVMDPQKVFEQFQLWRLVTAAFLHDPFTIWHIVWNMLFLWFFGRDLEDRFGQREFLTFYLVAGILGNLLWGITALWDPIVHQFGVYPVALGASGAVVAVTVLAACLYPNRTILLFFVIPTPLWLFAVILVAVDLYKFVGLQHTNVGVAAHLSGAAFAFLYYKFQWNLTGWWQDITSMASRRSKPKLRVYREEEPISVSSKPPSNLDEQLEAKMDEILDKIQRVGKENLSEEELAILRQASEEIKKKQNPS